MTGRIRIFAVGLASVVIALVVLILEGQAFRSGGGGNDLVRHPVGFIRAAQESGMATAWQAGDWPTMRIWAERQMQIRPHDAGVISIYALILAQGPDGIARQNDITALLSRAARLAPHRPDLPPLWQATLAQLNRPESISARSGQAE